MPKNFVGEPFSVSLLSGTEKVWIRGGGGGGVSRFSVENFLSHSAEKFRRGILYCCNNSGYRKSLIREGGSIKIFRRKFFVSQCRKIPWESLQCLRKFGVSKNFMHNSFHIIMHNNNHKFPPKVFCLTVPKKLRKGTL